MVLCACAHAGLRRSGPEGRSQGARGGSSVQDGSQSAAQRKGRRRGSGRRGRAKAIARAGSGAPSPAMSAEQKAAGDRPRARCPPKARTDRLGCPARELTGENFPGRISLGRFPGKISWGDFLGRSPEARRGSLTIRCGARARPSAGRGHVAGRDRNRAHCSKKWHFLPNIEPTRGVAPEKSPADARFLSRTRAWHGGCW
jgi:hypothetical protein